VDSSSSVVLEDELCRFDCVSDDAELSDIVLSVDIVSVIAVSVIDASDIEGSVFIVSLVPLMLPDESIEPSLLVMVVSVEVIVPPIPSSPMSLLDAHAATINTNTLSRASTYAAPPLVFLELVVMVVSSFLLLRSKVRAVLYCTGVKIACNSIRFKGDRERKRID